MNKFGFIKEQKTKVLRRDIESDYQKQIDFMETKISKYDKEYMNKYLK